MRKRFICTMIALVFVLQLIMPAYYSVCIAKSSGSSTGGTTKKEEKGKDGSTEKGKAGSTEKGKEGKEDDENKSVLQRLLDFLKKKDDEFKWTEGKQAEARESWTLTNWSKFQDELILEGFIPESTYADVDDNVRALKPVVEKVIRGTTPHATAYGAPRVECTELMLAMIQILKNNTMIDPDNESTEFNTWKESFGQYVTGCGGRDTPSQGWTLESSIQQLYLSFTASGYAYCYENGGKSFPTMVDTKKLPSIIEGTVMHYAYSPSEGTKKYYPGIYKVSYTDDKAETFYKTYKSEIDMFYNGKNFSDEDEDEPYIPSPTFAKDVLSIYKASPAYGTLGTMSKSEVLKYLFPDGVPSSKSEMESHMITTSVPIWDGSKETTMNLKVNKKLQELWKGIFTELTAMKFPINNGSTYAYSYRNKNGGTGLSSHAYGSSIDINPGSNPQIQERHNTGGTYAPGSDPKSVTPAVVALFKKYGFKWGGDWKSKKDYMHFTLTGD